MSNSIGKNKFFFVSIGAANGALLRWQFDDIFLVNIIGCFFIGVINALNIPPKYKLIFGVGFCGSLTTFSGWSFQLVQLISKGLYKLFFLNLFSILVIGLSVICLGDLFAKRIIN